MQVSKGLETRDHSDETETETCETETAVFGLETETMSRDLTSQRLEAENRENSRTERCRQETPTVHQ
jgi:hypothetical protein